MKKSKPMLLGAVGLLVALGAAPAKGNGCGMQGEPCCAMGQLCGDGLACVGDPGTCQPCGGSGETCCPSGRNRVCDEGLGCFGPDEGTCEACGALGQQCCPFLTNRCNTNLACDKTAGCVKAGCWACTCGSPLDQTVERCSTTSITVDSCGPCPSGTPGPFLETTPDACNQVPACEGKIVPVKSAPALSPIALASVCLLLAVIAFSRLRRASR